MKPFVFDTGAISLFYADDQRLRPFVDKIRLKQAEGFLSSVTLSEFYYKTCQTVGRDVANMWSRQLNERMQVVEVGFELSMAAGREKCRNGRLSLADAFALALSKSLRGTLFTTDSELAEDREASVKFFKV